MKLKHFVMAAFVAVGLLGTQIGEAEAANKIYIQKTKGNYHYVVTKQWKSTKNWCNVYYKNYKKGSVKKPNPVQEQPKQPAPAPKPAPSPEQPNQEQQVNQGLTVEEQQMLQLINEERQKRGLHPLKANLELTKVARIKAKDMIDNRYFSHQSPTYGSPFEMMKQFGISYRTAGENLAGNQTVEKAHQALMNSEGHRANILNAQFTEVGIGIVSGGPYGKMFVQMFKG